MLAPLRTTIPLLLLLAAALTGCSSGDDETSDEPSAGASVASEPPAPAAPKVGTCHALTLNEATEPVDPGPPIPCRRPHTSQTIKVGTLSLLADGHLLAVDSPTVLKRVAQACPPALGPHVGGDQTTQRLSRLEVVWFSPSLEQAEAGADWFRCDLVGLGKEGTLATLPRQTKGMLDPPDALDTYGTCGSAAPDAPGFQRLICSEPHTWRAVDVIDLPQDARLLAKDVGAAADAECKDIASERAEGELQYSWSFEWPTRPQWTSGQRYGYCWVPETG